MTACQDHRKERRNSVFALSAFPFPLKQGVPCGGFYGFAVSHHTTSIVGPLEIASFFFICKAEPNGIPTFPTKLNRSSTVSRRLRSGIPLIETVTH
jgi:hypothetical protein